MKVPCPSPTLASRLCSLPHPYRTHNHTHTPILSHSFRVAHESRMGREHACLQKQPRTNMSPTRPRTRTRTRPCPLFALPRLQSCTLRLATRGICEPDTLSLPGSRNPCVCVSTEYVRRESTIRRILSCPVAQPQQRQQAVIQQSTGPECSSVPPSTPPSLHRSIAPSPSWALHPLHPSGPPPFHHSTKLH